MLHSAPPVQLELFPYASPESVAGLGAIHRRYPGRQPSAQCLRMLTALTEYGALSSLFAFRHLDCLSPSARIAELRRAGHAIRTVRCYIDTGWSERHRIAIYVMNGGGAGPVVQERSSRPWRGGLDSTLSGRACSGRNSRVLAPTEI